MSDVFKSADWEADKLSMLRALFLGLTLDPETEWRERFRWFAGQRLVEELFTGDRRFVPAIDVQAEISARLASRT
jgi:hypothetical protein